jgi:3'5'-cyclic nucleotide phosphodiesterase
MEGRAFQLTPKTLRVVDWTVQSLMNILERLVKARKTHGLIRDVVDHSDAVSSAETPLEELKDFVTFHRYPEMSQDGTPLVLDQDIEDQLELYVGTIATRSPTSEDAFHCFDHASHATQTVLKLFSRMSSNGSSDDLNISADPLCVFACAFAAMIHDTEHPGVPNAKFKTENAALATMFKGRSLAEQHSFSVAWDLLQEERFTSLRQTLCPNAAETARFRRLVITAIIGTDLVDKELNDSRVRRWNEAFGSTGPFQTLKEESAENEVANRKATIIMELLVQAAHISHTMQHWYVLECP